MKACVINCLQKEPEVKAPIMAVEKVKLACPMSDTCEYETQELGIEYAMQLLDRHLLGVHKQAPAETTGTVSTPGKTGKIIRPRLELKDSYVEEERFAFFEHRCGPSM